MSFVAPWVLAGLVLLPVLWVLLRAMPPAPKRIVFGGLNLLLGLQDKTKVAAHTPWWLILLRLMIVTALIVGLSGPMLAPKTDTQMADRVLIVYDGGWVSNAQQRVNETQLEQHLSDAAQADRLVGVLNLADPKPVIFETAQGLLQRDDILIAQAVLPNFSEALDAIGDMDVEQYDTIWLNDGIGYGRERGALFEHFDQKGQVYVTPTSQAFHVASLSREGGQIQISVLRSQAEQAEEQTIEAYGADLNGRQTVLQSATISFDQGTANASVSMAIPVEILARVEGFRIAGEAYASAHRLAQASLKVREIGLISSRGLDETDALLDPNHYLKTALNEDVDLVYGSMAALIQANPNAIVLTDDFAVTNPDQLTTWLEGGGTLIRFAGPSLAAKTVNSLSDDPFLPVGLRPGGRSLGGAMTWGSPKEVRPFSSDSPFYGLPVPQDSRVYAQVLAQPSPELEPRVIARLQDGTPLVTRRFVGAGQIVLFHVSANPEWSNLPLSELFLDMLERLSSTAPNLDEHTFDESSLWRPREVMTGTGRLIDGSDFVSIQGGRLANPEFEPNFLPGRYTHNSKVATLNFIIDDAAFAPVTWPDAVLTLTETSYNAVYLAKYFFLAALLGFVLDSWIMILIFSQRRVSAVSIAIGVVSLCLVDGSSAYAQDQSLQEPQEVVLAHVVTGDAKVDEIALAGMVGLTDVLFFRTSVEPDPPHSVNLETDPLGMYPFLYWPVTQKQGELSQAAYDKLNSYLSTGGVILFDTRDADISSGRTNSALVTLSERLAIPPLEPVPSDHVLTRTFYLLDRFPGRDPNGALWVEATLEKGPQPEGLPFRPLNDGVSPVLVGGNDWAAAWAMREDGDPMLPVGSGFQGERQRELAYRFGVNLIMYILTGNYKSDQVHVPALLNRLGD